VSRIDAPPPTPPPDPSPEGAAATNRTLAGAVRAVSGVTLLSRLGGLVRDVLVVRIFGDTALGSAFQAAFQIPNLFRRLLGEGALSAAFIPAYTDARRGEGTADAGPRESDRLASLVFAALGAVAAGITILVELVLLVLLLTLPPDADRDLSFKLVMVMMPFMPLICGVAVLAGMLQVHGRFAASATGPLVLNAFIIAVAGYLLLTGRAGGEGTAYALGVATVLSGATQLVWFARLLRPYVRWTRDWRSAVPRARELLRKFVPVAIGLGTLQLSTFLDTFIAMWPNWVGPTMAGFTYPLDRASNAIITAMQRLYQFPLGVFGIAVATAVFPLLARHARDDDAFLATLRRGLRLSLFIGLPASAGLILVREDLTLLLYHGGQSGFSAEGVERGSAVLAGYAAAVWAYSLNHVLTRAFYAKGDTGTPVRISIACMGLTLALSLGLIWVLRDAGLAWAMAAGATVQCVLLAVRLRRTLGGASVLDGETVHGMLRVAAASVVMTAVAAAGLHLLPPGTDWTSELLRVAVGVALGGAVYIAACAALRAPELGWLLRRG
jgi:putative peptidoglycan lipid II flippase